MHNQNGAGAINNAISGTQNNDVAELESLERRFLAHMDICFILLNEINPDEDALRALKKNHNTLLEEYEKLLRQCLDLSNSNNTYEQRLFDGALDHRSTLIAMVPRLNALDLPKLNTRPRGP